MRVPLFYHLMRSKTTHFHNFKSSLNCSVFATIYKAFELWRVLSSMTVWHFKGQPNDIGGNAIKTHVQIEIQRIMFNLSFLYICLFHLVVPCMNSAWKNVKNEERERERDRGNKLISWGNMQLNSKFVHINTQAQTLRGNSLNHSYLTILKKKNTKQKKRDDNL